MSEIDPTLTDQAPPPDLTIDLRESMQDTLGVGALEERYADSPAALAVNVAMATVTALRFSPIVLRTNRESSLLGATSTHVIEQSFARIIDPELTHFAPVYLRIQNDLIGDHGNRPGLSRLLESYVANRKSYLQQFESLDNETRYRLRTDLLESDQFVRDGLEFSIEHQLAPYIRGQAELPEGYLEPEVLELLCEKIMHLGPMTKTVRGIATAGLVAARRGHGFSPHARAWFRTQLHLTQTY